MPNPAQLDALARIIEDYRSGEIPRPTAAHVKHWLAQFPAAVQDDLLAEMTHVLGRTYLTRATVEAFLQSVVTSKALAGNDPAAFWSGVKFLNVQTKGNSQREMLALLDSILRRRHGYGIIQCGLRQPHTYLYLDDGLFSGGRIQSDLTDWIRNAAPRRANVVVVVMALHLQGEYFATKNLADVIAKSGKEIEISWKHAVAIENRAKYVDASDVLRPTMIPSDRDVQAYVQGLGRKPELRRPGNVGGLGFFSSEGGRNLLEQELLKAGVRIRNMCGRLTEFQRPLGNTTHRTVGFGSTVVTFRNCPNNAPLAFWAGNPWYPLFPRKTN